MVLPIVRRPPPRREAMRGIETSASASAISVACPTRQGNWELDAREERRPHGRTRARHADLAGGQGRDPGGRDTVVIAFGATEQHGPHMPLATDALLGDHMARRSPSGSTPSSRRRCASAAPSTTSASPARCRSPSQMHAVVADLVRSLADGGFRRSSCCLARRQLRTARRQRWISSSARSTERAHVVRHRPVGALNRAARRARVRRAARRRRSARGRVGDLAADGPTPRAGEDGAREAGFTGDLRRPSPVDVQRRRAARREWGGRRPDAGKPRAR